MKATGSARGSSLGDPASHGTRAWSCSRSLPELRRRRRYYRELLLPFPVSGEGIQWSLRNGVLELELSRADPPDAGRRIRS
jgi:HSP20 family molecular chaperone IbpA